MDGGAAATAMLLVHWLVFVSCFFWFRGDQDAYIVVSSLFFFLFGYGHGVYVQ